MLEAISERFSESLRAIRGVGKITAKNIQDTLDDVKKALLEADVAYDIAQRFATTVQEKAIGTRVVQSVTPGQQFIKIVYEELVALFGVESHGLAFRGRTPHRIMLVGLQGAGKTTTAVKLAYHLRANGRRPYLVPADLTRPAAALQLRILARENQLDVDETDNARSLVKLVSAALDAARKAGADTVIIDTAGRLHIDTAEIDELKAVQRRIEPDEVLLVADAMTGQRAVEIATAFDQALGITGVILTKMDGDARGGAALSIYSAIGKPIKFVGVGEKIDRLEPFHPDRVAGRILDMGDVVTLVERAQAVIDEKKAEALQQKINRNQFTIDDFLEQLTMIRKIGSVESILGMLPGMGQIKKALGQVQQPEQELHRIEAIIGSMTRTERQNHLLLNQSRRRRIASGAGVSVTDVNRFVKQFGLMKEMMKKMKKLGKGGGLDGLPFPPGIGPFR